MDPLHTLGLIVRAIVVAVGFIAMWGLWTSMNERRKLWTSKMFDIWFCHMLFVFGAIEANMELLYRKVQPTFSTFVILLALLISLRGSFNGEKYTKDDA